MARISESTCYKDEADRHKQYIEACEYIALQVKRHIDNVYDVSVEFDTEHVCEYCGAEWSEADKDYNGGCCNEDQAAHEAKTDRRLNHDAD